MAFDVVYANGIDYRTGDKYTLIGRIAVLNEIIDKCFGTYIPFADFTDKNTDLEQDKIREVYIKNSNNIGNFWKKIENKKNIFVSRKLYFVPYGIDPSEIFMYAI